jgi:glutamine amidotransferase
VVRFDLRPPLKVPHMGWNASRRGPAADRSPALRPVNDGTWFYYVHSFYPVPADPRDVALETDHGGRFCVAVARDNLTACQFHPEKSQEAGLALLSRFLAG